MTEAELASLIRSYGLLILLPIGLIEGPVVAVIAGYLSRLSLIGLVPAYAGLVLADLLGDALLYAVGRRGRIGPAQRWLARLGLTRRHLARALRAVRRRGGQFLVIGKLTHSAGFAVLLAAGMARMPFGLFLGWNLLATLPKVAAFMALGWTFGEIAARVGDWLFAVTLTGLLVLAGVGIAIFIHHRRTAP